MVERVPLLFYCNIAPIAVTYASEAENQVERQLNQ